MQTIKFFCPLTVKNHPSLEYGKCGSDEHLEELSQSEAIYLLEKILVATEKEKLKFKNHRGLLAYLDENNPLSEKVYSLYPTAEIWNGRVWGVILAVVNSELDEAETAKLIDYCTWQMSDVWGYIFEQHPIKVEGGEIYVSFWNSENFYIKSEKDLKQG